MFESESDPRPSRREKPGGFLLQQDSLRVKFGYCRTDGFVLADGRVLVRRMAGAEPSLAICAPENLPAVPPSPCVNGTDRLLRCAEQAPALADHPGLRILALRRLFDRRAADEPILGGAAPTSAAARSSRTSPISARWFQRRFARRGRQPSGPVRCQARISPNATTIRTEERRRSCSGRPRLSVGAEISWRASCSNWSAPTRNASVQSVLLAHADGA